MVFRLLIDFPDPKKPCTNTDLVLVFFRQVSVDREIRATRFFLEGRFVTRVSRHHLGQTGGNPAAETISAIAHLQTSGPFPRLLDLRRTTARSI